MAKFTNYLRQFSATQGCGWTHTRIGGDTYMIPEEKHKEFMDFYYQSVFIDGNKETMQEKQIIDDGPLLINFDFRYDQAISTSQHTSKDVTDIVMIYASEITGLMNFKNNDEIDVFVMERKTGANQLDNKTTDGIHILFNIKMNKTLQLELRKFVLPRVKEIFNSLPITNAWEDVIDEGVVKGFTHWTMLGSHKHERDPYEVKYHIKLTYKKENWTFKDHIAAFKIEDHFYSLSARNKNCPEFPVKKNIVLTTTLSPSKIKEVQAWKTTFYKNASSEGGAMKHAIQNLPEDNVVIHSQTVKNGRMWGFTTPAKLLTLIEKNKGLYEVITAFPHKLYFDIDGAVPLALDDIKSIIEDFFPNADMAVSGSITDAKTSYHIIVNNYVIHNEAERCYVKTVVKHIHDSINKAFDPVVYNKNRNMKCINQSKDDGRIQSIIENEDYKHHLITCFIPEYSLPFPELKGEMEEVVMIQKAKEIFDLGTLPKMKRTEPEGFDITIATPLQILSVLPIDKNFNHDYTHLIARFCFYNGIELKSFLAWLQPKHASSPLDFAVRWTHNWTRLDKFPPVTAKRIEAILNYYYPHLLKDKPYKRFLNTFVADPTCIRKIDTIEPSHFEVENKFIIFNTGMGSGKTTQTINYLKTAGHKFLWLCPNKALAHNTLYRLEQEDVDTKYYLNYNAKQKNNGILNDVGSLIVVLNSLHYLGGDATTPTASGIEESVPSRPFSIIVIDEIETLLDKFLGDFMKNKKEVWIQFLRLLRNADKVILLDAFITSKTLDFIKRAVPAEGLGAQPLMYERIIEPTTRTVNYIKNDATMINDIITKLKDNKKCFIYYPYKYQSGNNVGMEKFSNMLKLATGKDGVFYNADVDDAVKATLKDVNKAWKPYDYVITNNIITCGVNYDTLNDFDESYIFIASFSCPRDIIQVSYRVRDLVNKKINVCYLGRMNQPNTFISDTHHMDCKIYSGLIDAVLVEKYSPLKATFQLFCIKAHYNQTVDKHVISAELSKYVADLKDSADCGFSYKNIPDIDNKVAQRIEQKMFSQDASMLEKMMLKKYYFLLEWRADSIAIKTDADADVGQIEYYWNCNCMTFFQQLKRIIFEKNSLFANIKKFNGFVEFFPTDEEIKKVKLNDVLLDEIFKEFKFKFISRITNPKKIVQEIYNTYFKTQIILSVVPDGQHHSHYFLNSDSVHSYYDFALNNMKQPVINELAEKLMPEDEAVCCL